MSLHVAESHPTGAYHAQIVCDECGGEIQTAADGNIEWRADGENSDLFFTHKLCRRRFERSRRGSWSTDELANLPIRLAASLRLPIEVVPEDGATVGYVLRGRLIAGDL
jgi:hypothetical protein